MTRRRRATLPAMLASAMVLVATACTDDADPPADAPPYADVPCPLEVSSLVVGEAVCGYLTVPENRAEPDRTIRLFVVRVPAPESAQDAEPIFVAGTDVADVPNIAGIAPMAQRTGREVIILDPRGLGHSEPALDCAEVRDLSAPALETATDDPVTRDAFLAAVAECHERLTEDGIDVSAYNLTEMAADAEDLRRALDIDTWNVATFGTASRISFEMLRSSPEHIRAVLMDSPEWPGVDPRAVAVTGTTDALADVLAACADDAACAAAYPTSVESVTEALEQYDRDPVTVVGGQPPNDGTVRFDAAMLLRMLRHALTGDSVGGLYLPEAVPSIVAAALAGRTDDLSELAGPLLGDDPYCTGYQPRCSLDGRTVSAVDYTVLCHDIAPFADPAAPGRLAADRVGYATAFGRSPYLDLCASWPVGAAAGDIAEAVQSDVPVLAMVGAFNPYVRPDQAEDGLGGLRSLTLLIDPAGGHNVMPRTDCMLDLRQAFLDDPTQPVAADCLEAVSAVWPLP